MNEDGQIFDMLERHLNTRATSPLSSEPDFTIRTALQHTVATGAMSTA